MDRRQDNDYRVNSYSDSLPSETSTFPSESAPIEKDIADSSLPDMNPIMDSDSVALAPGNTLPNPTLLSKLTGYMYFARLEVFFALYVFSDGLSDTCVQDLLLQKACLNSLQWNSSICNRLDQYPLIKDESEKIASDYSMLGSVISLAPSVGIAILIGPWCDRYGYKTPVLISNLGSAISTMLVLCTAYRMPLPLFYNLLAAIPEGLLGGMIAIFMAVYSEATLSSSARQRRVKFFLLDLVMAAAYPLGNFIGGQIYGNFGIRAVLRTSVCVSLVAELWALFVFDVPERAKALGDGVWTKLGRLLQVRNLVDSFRACFRVRPARGRTQLWLLFSSLCLMVMDLASMSVAYYYVREMYSWSVEQYSNVSAVSSAVTYIFYAPLVYLFTRVLNISDVWMAVTGVSFAVAQLLVRGLAYKEWLYYLQYAIGIPSFIGHVGTRTYLSKLLGEDEVGKIFSLLASCEAIIPIAGAVVFTKIFESSLDFFPGLVYVIAAFVSFCSFLLLVYCARISSHSYSPLQKENEPTSSNSVVSA